MRLHQKRTPINGFPQRHRMTATRSGLCQRPVSKEAFGDARPLSEGGEGQQGVDLGSVVSVDYFDRRPFRFNGKIERVEVNLDARMSALGQKQTCALHYNVCLVPKADIVVMTCVKQKDRLAAVAPKSD